MTISRAYFRCLLRAVPTRSALIEFSLAFKFACCFWGFHLGIALNLLKRFLLGHNARMPCLFGYALISLLCNKKICGKSLKKILFHILSISFSKIFAGWFFIIFLVFMLNKNNLPDLLSQLLQSKLYLIDWIIDQVFMFNDFYEWSCIVF